MPAWSEAGDSDTESWKLVYFIRHLPKMTSQEAEEMKKLNPKTAMEMREEQQEEQFLNGDTSIRRGSDTGDQTHKVREDKQK
jgi:hypothetical protein